mmetsp:Transcript_200/g.439  ORF Transcript_200/g.439 Transcript_200/m.439 type:complete len:202 (+) Transcript_200:74-679(+)
MVRGKAESFHTQLASKQYRDAVREVLRTTAVRPSDLDGKALALLDALQQHGRAREACQYLKQALEGLPRDRISNWRAYAYTLLRGFDEAAYEAMKADRTNQRRRRSRATPLVATPSLNERAAEFVPGQPWPPLRQATTELARGQSEGSPADTQEEAVAPAAAEATNAQAANAQATPRWGLALLAATAVATLLSLAWVRRRR